MTLTNLLNSRLVNHSNLVNNNVVTVNNSVPNQQNARMTLSSITSSPVSSQSQAFPIAGNNNFATGFSTVPITATATSGKFVCRLLYSR